MSPEREDIQALTEDYLHGLLGPEEARRVEALVARDEAWRTALDAARRRLDAVQGVPGSEASESLIQRTLARVEREAVASAAAPAAARSSWFLRPRSGLFAAGLAAVVALLASLHLHFDSLAPGPIDLRIMGQNEIMAGTSGSMRVSLINRETGRPVAGAPVEFLLHRPDTGRTVSLTQLVTDEQGTAAPQINWPAWPSGLCELRVVARTASHGEEELSRRVRLVQAWRLDLAADRPVYEPGQVVNLRALASDRTERRALAERDIVFSVLDAQGNVVEMKSAKSSRFGIASASIALPPESREGTYAIECFLGDTITSGTIEVRRRSAAWFRLDASLDRPFHQPGQILRGQIDASLFSGQPLRAAVAEVRLESPEADAPLAGPIAVALDDRGRGSFELALPGKPSGESLAADGREGPTTRAGRPARDRFVSVVASVTDSQGRREVRRLESVVAAQPLRIEFVPEAGELVPGVANRVYLLASYPDGRPAPARLTVTGLDAGQDDLAPRTLETDSAGVARIDLVPRGQGVALAVKAADAQGLVAQQETYLAVGARRAGEDFLIRTDRAVYRGGDAVRVLVLGAGHEPVFIDLIQDGQTIRTGAVTGSTGEWVERLPANAEGTLRIRAYRMSAGRSPGTPVCRERWIEVRPADDIHVALEADHAAYKPGDEAKVRLRLTDAQGKPAPGALSLAAIDEAVIARGRSLGSDGLRSTGELSVGEGATDRHDDLDSSVGSGVSGGSGDSDSSRREALLARAAARAMPAPDPMRELVEGGFIDARDAEAARAVVRETWGSARLSQMVRSGLIPEQAIRLLSDGDAAAAANSRATVRLIAQRDEPVLSPASARAADPTLSASSYPTKSVRVAAQRRMMLAWINAGWVVVAVGAMVAAFFALLRHARTPLAVALMSVALFAAVGGVMFWMNAGSRSYLGGSAVAELRAVGQALDRAGQAGVLPMSLREGADDAAAPAPRPSRSPRLDRAAAPPRTLLWQPELITDDRGEATLQIPLPDVATTWRLQATAVNRAGDLGAAATSLRVEAGKE